MGMNVGIGLSQHSNSFDAGKEAARQGRLQIGGNAPGIIIVFASPCYAQNELIKGVNSIFGTCPLAGCSSIAQISPSGISKRSVVCVCIGSNSARFSIGRGKNTSYDSRSAGQNCARECISKEPFQSGKASRNLFLMFPDGLAPNGQELIRGAQEIFGSSFPIIGGSSADELLFKDTYQYYNDEVYTNSVVGILMGGNLKIGIGTRHGWQPIGKPRIATKSYGNRLKEIDGKPAIGFYEEYFAKETEDMKNKPLARISLQYPLGMPIAGEDEYLLRNVIKVNADGSLLCTGEIPQGSPLQLMLGNKESAINAARLASAASLEQLKGSQPKLALIFESVARLKLLGNDAQKEIDTVRQILGHKLPIAGFYTYGEQSPLKSDIHLGGSYFHNETILVVSIGD